MFRKARLRHAERALKDAVHHYDRWRFGNTPSQDEDEQKRIYALIRRVEKLGGDAEECFDAVFTRYDRDYLLAEAMPEVFERIREDHSNYWYVVRKAS